MQCKENIREVNYFFDIKEADMFSNIFDKLNLFFLSFARRRCRNKCMAMKNEKLLMRIVNQNLLYGSFNPDPGLFNGRMGMVIFFFHYARYTANEWYENFAGEILDDIYEDITDDMPLGLTNGICGVGWGMLYLIQQGFVEGEVDEVLEMIDRKIAHLPPRQAEGMEHYLRFRSALTDTKADSYSPSEIIRKIMAQSEPGTLSWQNGLKIVWDETSIHSK